MAPSGTGRAGLFKKAYEVTFFKKEVDEKGKELRGVTGEWIGSKHTMSYS